MTQPESAFGPDYVREPETTAKQPRKATEVKEDVDKQVRDYRPAKPRRILIRAQTIHDTGQD